MFSFSQKHVAWNQKPGVLSKIFRKKKSISIYLFLFIFYLFIYLFFDFQPKKFFIFG